ncbi:MAG TPA: phosphonoacetaldehyde reductase [Gammaproteobacteria bacterium]
MTTETWQYHNPVRVIFARGAVDRLADHLGYQRIVLVTSSGFSRRGVVERIRHGLGERLLAVFDDVKPNPDVLDIDAQARRARPLQPDCILALGGGSSMDTAKALARLLTQPETMTLAAHFREGRELSASPALPVVAIPTTSGTGAEVTPFGTVWDFEKKRKYSVTGDDLYSAIAILDPDLAAGLPEEMTIGPGLDAISHALESAWNRNANPVTLGFVAKSLQLSLPALARLKAQPDDIDARGDMMQASLLAGLAISQTRTALAHSISYPLTTAFRLPHGIACSFTLPALMEFNAAADDGRLQDLARAVGCADIAEFAASLRDLFHRLDVAAIFGRYITDADAVMALTGNMFTPGRADNNLRAASADDVIAIVRQSLADVASGYTAMQ